MGSPLSFLLLSFLLSYVLAGPVNVSYSDCFNPSANESLKFDISTVYAQALHDDNLGPYLNLTILGNSPARILESSNTSGSLAATLFTTTEILTLNAWTNISYLCETLRPASPLPSLKEGATNYCPLGAGEFGLSSTIPWGDSRALTTLVTRLRAVDTFSNELMCLDVSTTPLDPSGDNPYGQAVIIFWCTVGLAIAYWVIVGLARIVCAWSRGRGGMSRHAGIWPTVQSLGYVLASAISGERLSASPALLRFCTPSLRDVLWHSQWCTALAMVAVQWPPSIYPLLTQTAWSSLIYNITIAADATHHWYPLHAEPYNPRSDFADQLDDSGSVLYIDRSAPNVLFMLPENATNGISSFAYALGLRPQDLFGVSIVIFLAIVAATIVVSVLLWVLDGAVNTVTGGIEGGLWSSGKYRARSPGPGFAAGSKDMLEAANPTMAGHSTEENKSLNGHGLFRPPSRYTLSGPGPLADRGVGKSFLSRMRPDASSFHAAVLYGNLVRLLLFFYLPVTIFSSYHMTLSADVASATSRALAGLVFGIISVLIPALLLLRVHFTSTNKLYDETRTLLSLGPLYNLYRPKSHMFGALFFAVNFALGVTIGCGQKSGLAQAIVILIIEVVGALVTSIWLPWGVGASMGLINFLMCVARVVIAVLLVILTPTIDIGAGPGGWVAYGILVILALVYLAFTLMLVMKLVEAMVRIVGQVGFDRSTHTVDTGLLGACGLLGCCGSRRQRRRRRHTKKSSTNNYDAKNPQHMYNLGKGTPATPNMFVPQPPFMGNIVNGSKASTHSHSEPPSVLRPEHALRPYKEDSDDEGYIMAPFGSSKFASMSRPNSGYLPVSEPPQPQPAQSMNNKGGFSRVGGGRAHIDDPYATLPGGGSSVHTFPSINKPTHHLATYATSLEEDDSPPPSVSHVARHPNASTSSGFQPHTRTKSQTAIIEDPSVLAQLRAGAVQEPPTTAPVEEEDESYDSDDSNATTRPKKKPWFRIRGRNRVQSQPSMSMDEEAGFDSSSSAAAAAAATATPAPQGRSFVVIRKPQGGPAPR
ncbi:hypothetical protein BD626DRAFT_545135 [Schizophyllum amplum]|uniref:TRP C-terminal domain-containing protein n=1 Tax=Schizophyllum amplum TaxID=97359 RepID=A0A550CSP7_9AGAR|nr:hypothetical protein BD626DRAFT_545135 [Auriculariopsis ampla]